MLGAKKSRVLGSRMSLAMRRGRRPLTWRNPGQGLRLVCRRAGGASHNATGGFAGWSGDNPASAKKKLHGQCDSNTSKIKRDAASGDITLSGGDIDDQLSELICIARALLAFRPDGHLRVFLSLEVSFLPYLES